MKWSFFFYSTSVHNVMFCFFHLGLSDPLCYFAGGEKNPTVYCCRNIVWNSTTANLKTFLLRQCYHILSHISHSNLGRFILKTISAHFFPHTFVCLLSILFLVFCRSGQMQQRVCWNIASRQTRSVIWSR